eukprot:scaffold76316_cov52-Phaeocystis_antarctica.AAC.1
MLRAVEEHEARQGLGVAVEDAQRRPVAVRTLVVHVPVAVPRLDAPGGAAVQSVLQGDPIGVVRAERLRSSEEQLSSGLVANISGLALPAVRLGGRRPRPSPPRVTSCHRQRGPVLRAVVQTGARVRVVRTLWVVSSGHGSQQPSPFSGSDAEFSYHIGSVSRENLRDRR